MYQAMPAKGPAGASVPVGWKIIVIRDVSYYVKEKDYSKEYALSYLRNR